MSDCPTRPVLQEFLAEALAGALEHEIRKHLDGCAACQQALEEMVAAAEPDWSALRRVTPGPPEELDFLRELQNSLPQPDSQDEKLVARVRRTPLSEVSLPGYEILGELGRGAMGVVVKARQVRLNRMTAVKMIRLADLASPEVRGRFHTEAQAAAQLQHPNIIQIYEIGESDGLPFFSMEYIAGGSLAEHLAGRPLPVAEAAGLVETVARAVHYAHQRGIVHRDLKPANILLAVGSGQWTVGSKAGSTAADSVPTAHCPLPTVPKVSDFGLARRLQDLGQTRPGVILGTPSYMAPEQAAGRTAEIGPPADIHALGAILYELLTGRPPYVAEGLEATLAMIQRDDAVAPRLLNRSVPRDLEVICLKCLEKDPGQRYGTAEGLANDLRRWQAGESILARPAGRAERLGRWCRRNPWLALLTGMSVSLLLIAVIASSWGWWSSELRSRDLEQQKQLVEQHDNEMRDQKDATARQLVVAEENLYTAHLAQIDSLHEREPMVAFQRLHSDTFCPPRFRDTAWRFYDRACSRWLLADLSTGPHSRVNALVYSPEGRTFVTAGDGLVHIWDDLTRQVVRTLDGHDGFIWDVCFNRDGSRLATAGGDGTARLWDSATGKLLHTFRHTQRVNTVAFSPDGKTLATGSHEFVVKLWDVVDDAVPGVSDQPRTVLASQNAWICAVRFNPEGTTLASSSGNGLVCLWDVAEVGRAVGPPKPRKVIRLPKEVTTIAFSPDGQLLATGSHDVPVKFWDAVTGELRATFPALEYRPRSIAFSLDGQTLVTGDSTAVVRLWNVPTRQLRLTLEGHSGDVTGVALHPGGQRLVSSGRNGDVKLWRLSPDASLFSVEGMDENIHGIAFSADGKTLACGSRDRYVLLLDVESEIDSPSPSATRRRLAGHEEDIRGVALSSDGQTLMAYGANRITLWDLRTGRSRDATPPVPGELYQVALSPDGKLLAAARGAPVNGVQLLDAATGDLRQTIQPLGAHIAFSPDGATLAIPSADAVELWDVAGQRSRRIPILQGGKSLSVAWGPDGRIMGVCLTKSRLILVDTTSGQTRLLRDLMLNGPGLAFHRDGTMALGMLDGRIQLWHVPSIQPRATLRGHMAIVRALAFDPSGERLASVSQDGVLKVWDLASR